MFNQNSGLVSVWLDLIAKGIKTIEDVPAIGNLQEVVRECADA